MSDVQLTGGAAESFTHAPLFSSLQPASAVQKAAGTDAQGMSIGAPWARRGPAEPRCLPCGAAPGEPRCLPCALFTGTAPTLATASSSAQASVVLIAASCGCGCASGLAGGTERLRTRRYSGKFRPRELVLAKGGLQEFCNRQRKFPKGVSLQGALLRC